MNRTPLDTEVLKEVLDSEMVRNLPGSTVVHVALLTLDVYKRKLKELKDTEAKNVDY